MKSEALFARAGEVFNGDASKNTYTEVIQYNITVGGKVEKSVTFDFKNFKFVQSAVTPNDIEITIDDELFIGLFTSSLKLVELNSQGKIQVKGNVGLLPTLDSRRSAYKQ